MTRTGANRVCNIFGKTINILQNGRKREKNAKKMWTFICCREHPGKKSHHHDKSKLPIFPNVRLLFGKSTNICPKTHTYVNHGDCGDLARGRSWHTSFHIVGRSFILSYWRERERERERGGDVTHLFLSVIQWFPGIPPISMGSHLMAFRPKLIHRPC